MRQISKIHFTPKGELSNNFISLKKFELRTESPTKNKPTQLMKLIYFLLLQLLISLMRLIIKKDQNKDSKVHQNKS